MAWSLPLLLLIPYRGDIGDAFWLMGPYKGYHRTTIESPQCALQCDLKKRGNLESDHRRPGLDNKLAAAGCGLLTGETIK